MILILMNVSVVRKATIVLMVRKKYLVSQVHIAICLGKQNAVAVLKAIIRYMKDHCSVNVLCQVNIQSIRLLFQYSALQAAILTF